MVEPHGVHGTRLAETFFVNVALPNGVGFPNIRETKGDLGLGGGILIGMDIITRGDFSVSNFQGKTVMSFRCPSCETTDFVKAQKTPVRSAVSVGRNDPCHCGSGKKLKKCHGAANK